MQKWLDNQESKNLQDIEWSESSQVLVWWSRDHVQVRAKKMMKSISIAQLREEKIMENPSLLAYSSMASSCYSGKKNEGENEDEVTDRNIRALLSQKEKDLILAAELGKALLEKNEDLSQQNEKMTEEFSKQIEVG